MMIQKQRSQEASEPYSQAEYVSPVDTLCIPFLLQPPKGTNRKRGAKSKCFISAQHTFMDVGGFYACFQDFGSKSLELFISLSFCKYSTLQC